VTSRSGVDDELMNINETAVSGASGTAVDVNNERRGGANNSNQSALRKAYSLATTGDRPAEVQELHRIVHVRYAVQQ